MDLQKRDLEFVKEAIVELFGVNDIELENHPLVLEYQELTRHGDYAPCDFLADVICINIREGIVEILGSDPGPFTRSSRFREDLCLDSLDLVELAIYAEEVFCVFLDDSLLADMSTVEDFVELLFGSGRSQSLNPAEEK